MELKLIAQIRENKEKLSHDFLPAVLYGKGLETQSLKLKRTDFEKLFKVAGESNLIDLELKSGSVKVLVKDFQRDVIKSFITHVDFYQVNMKEKVTTEIPLHLIGESKAVRELGGTLMSEVQVIEVECLPIDLIDHIDVDVSVLVAFDDAIRLGDIKLPATMTLTADPSNVVVAVKEPRKEEEKPVESVTATTEEEVEAGEKKEGEASTDDHKADAKDKKE